MYKYFRYPGGWLQLGKPFEISLVTLFPLPSPFVIPLLIKESVTEEKEYVNNNLATQTAITTYMFSQRSFFVIHSYNYIFNRV